MSKMLEATCVGGVVTSQGIPVPAAQILSEGVGLSSGVLFLDEDRAKYFTSNASDLKTTLEQIASALTSIASALTLLDAKPLGTLPPAPAAAANITQIIAVQAQVTALGELLK
jgi:hypothetical protein